jgi:nucleoid-associated protein YgaU
MLAPTRHRRDNLFNGRMSRRSIHDTQKLSVWMQVRFPAQGPSLESRKAFLCCTAFLLLLAIPARSQDNQDVAEAARQQKAQKAAGQKSPRHVYTEEDLKHKTILTPEDQARVEARKQQDAVPAEQNAKQQTPDEDNTQTESLGEVARRFRQEKAEREAELAAKKKFSPFTYEVPDDSLAEPKPEVSPLLAPLNNLAPIAKPLPPISGSVPRPVLPSSSAHRRVSPFQPRPMMGIPAIPSAPVFVAPTLPVRPPEVPVPHTLVLAPAPAKVAPLVSTPSGTRQIGVQKIEVQHGQSWWKLAEIYLGSGSRWPELRKLNANLEGSADLLKSGSVVVVPESAAKPQASAQTLQVRAGDSLWSLAQRHLGHGSAWACLANANPQITNYTHIPVGTQLRLPDTSALRSCQDAVASKK